MSDETKTETETNENETLTKPQLLEKLEVIQAENDLLKSAGNHDLSWYGKEIERLTREKEEKDAIIKGWESRKHEQEREAAILLEDKKKEEERQNAHYKQTEHTRFRLLDRPSIRDVYGDTIYPVFDLGVELVMYDGPVQVPAHFIQEMAESIGMLPVAEAERLREERDFAKAKNEHAARLGTELTSGISQLVDKFYLDLDSVTSDAVPESESSTENKSGTADDNSESGKTDGQANGDNSGKKSDGVPSNSGNANDGNDDPDGLKSLLS